MTSPRRFEQDLPALLADLYLAGTPDYRDDIVRQIARTPQRPAWTFPERWLPMADIASRPTFAPRLPWRTIGVGLLLAALLIAALAAYIGSQTTRLPSPFGPARNGLVAYSADGDIFTVDPVSGVVTAVVTGPDADRRPRFSPDGTKLAFLRERPDALGRFDIVVTARDGSGARVLAGADSITTDDVVEWAPDSTYLLVGTGNGDVLRYDIASTAPPEIVAQGAYIFPGAFRPPDGAQILYEMDTADSTAFYVMDADGTNAKLLLERPAAGRVGSITANARWSPDGRMIAFGLVTPTSAESRVHVINADGSGLRQVGDQDGTWVENDLVWSPDSTHLAFNRWEQAFASAWQIRPIGVVPATGGAVRDLGPVPVSDGAVFDYSPDGSTIVSVSGPLVLAPPTGAREHPVLIDTSDGSSESASWDVLSGTSWQRLAP